MSIPVLNKMHINGYDVLSVNNGPMAGLYPGRPACFIW